MKALSPLLLGVDSGVGSSASSTASSTSPRFIPTASPRSSPRASPHCSPRSSPKTSPPSSPKASTHTSPQLSPRPPEDADHDEENNNSIEKQAARRHSKSPEKEKDIERDFRFLLESLGFICDPREVLQRVGCRPPASPPPPAPPPTAALRSAPAAVQDDAAPPLKRAASGPSGPSTLRQRNIRPHQRNLLSLHQLRHIKNIVDLAVTEQKIFTICGAFPSVREALRSRGWLEKKWVANEYPRDNSMARDRDRESRDREKDKDKDSTEKDKENKDETEKDRPKVDKQDKGSEIKERSKSEDSMQSLLDALAGEELNEKAVVARLLRGVHANFIWTVKFDGIDWKRLKKRQIINRFPKAFFTTKIGLSTFLRQMHWFSEEGVSLTRFPRCYNICQPDDMEAFVDDFRLTACLGMLKWLVETVERVGANAVQGPQGKLPKAALEFAMARCREFLLEHSNEDLDRGPPPPVYAHQWDQFLGWYYLLHCEDVALNSAVPEPAVPELYAECRWLLERLAPLWPQLQLDGRLNVWILKPGAKSRGRGIHLVNRLDLLTAHVSSTHIRDARYVAQKYIERPLLIFGTKFDIRQWFLVTSVYPMTIWMYRESYLRFCSQSFTLQNMHESVHLCNNAVQAKYANGKRDPALPDENMWDCYTFQTYLRAMGRADLWDTVIYPGMRQGIVGSLLASQEHMDRRGDCFELFGADFMLTEDFVPWLIEINSCPCMAPSTSVTARMCAQCLEDVIKVVIDRRSDRSADTGMFELVYRQQIPPPPPYLGMSLSVRGRKIQSGAAYGARRRRVATQESDQAEQRCRRSGLSDLEGESPAASHAHVHAHVHAHAQPPRRVVLEPARAQAGLAAVGTPLRVTRCATTLTRRRRHRLKHPGVDVPASAASALPLLHRQRPGGGAAAADSLLAVGMSLRPHQHTQTSAGEG